MKKIPTSLLHRGFLLTKLGTAAGLQLAREGATRLLGVEPDSSDRNSIFEKAVKELGRMKGSALKVGQMFSIYGEHFLPPEHTRLLKTLQRDTPFVDWPVMQKQLTNQLGAAKMALLSIDQSPIAAASIGQVYRAKVKSTGEKVVLKVQYPKLEKSIDQDLRILQTLFSFLEISPKFPNHEEIFSEISYMLKKEMNYEEELKQLDFFSDYLSDSKLFIVPKSRKEFSTRRVLCMEEVNSKSLDTLAEEVSDSGVRNQLGLGLLDLFFQELFILRRVQTDAHAGNYGWQIENGSHKIVLYDFGATRSFSKEFLQKYRNLLVAALAGEREAFQNAAQSLQVLEKGDPDQLVEIFWNLCTMICEPFSAPEFYDWGKSDLPKRVMQLSWDLFKGYPLRAPPREIVFLNRKLAGVFTLMKLMQVTQSGRATIRKYIQDDS